MSSWGAGNDLRVDLISGIFPNVGLFLHHTDGSLATSRALELFRQKSQYLVYLHYDFVYLGQRWLQRADSQRFGEAYPQSRARMLCS